MFKNQIAKNVSSSTKLVLFEVNNQALRFLPACRGRVTFWIQKVTMKKAASKD
jgi:hypothetical protein